MQNFITQQELIAIMLSTPLFSRFWLSSEYPDEYKDLKRLRSLSLVTGQLGQDNCDMHGIIVVSFPVHIVYRIYGSSTIPLIRLDKFDSALL